MLDSLLYGLGCAIGWIYVALVYVVEFCAGLLLLLLAAFMVLAPFLAVWAAATEHAYQSRPRNPEE